MKRRLPFLIPLTSVCVALGIASAVVSEASPADESKSVFAMSLDELIEMKVVTPTKAETSLQKAAAVVSVLTAQDIKKLGVQTISEAIAFLPGIMTYKNTTGMYHLFSIRGDIVSEHYNSKILFLLNGHPVYSPMQGSFEVDLVPINAIERIELVRGPASVLYGTNALTGVINIITRKGLDTEREAGASYRYSTSDVHEGRVNIGQRINDFGFYFAGSFRDQQQYNLTMRPDQDEAGLGAEVPQWDQNAALFLNLQYKGVEMDISYGRKDYNVRTLGSVNTNFLGDRALKEQYHIDLRYVHEFSERVRLSSILRYEETLKQDWWSNDSYALTDMVLGQSGPPREEHADFTSKKWGAEVYSNIGVIEKLDLLVGVVFDGYYDCRWLLRDPWLNSGISPISPVAQYTDGYDAGIYTNASYQILESTQLLGGLRYSKNGKAGGHWDYRLGLINEPTENLILKFMYGTAYRSPNLMQLYYDTYPIVVGDETLDPETMEGLDVSLSWRYQHLFIGTFSYYWNGTKDYITRVPAATGSVYANIQGAESQGLELELRCYPHSLVDLFLNLSHILDYDVKEPGIDELIIKDILSFGASVHLFDRALTLNNANLYHSSWGEAGGYIISNLALYYTPPVGNRNIELFVTANNVADQSYDYAEYTRRNVGTTPGGPGRSVTIGAEVTF